MTLKCTSGFWLVALATIVLANTGFASSMSLTSADQSQPYAVSTNIASTLTSVPCESASRIIGPSMTSDGKALRLISNSRLSGSFATQQAQLAPLFSTHTENDPLFTSYAGVDTDVSYFAQGQTASNRYTGLLLYTPLHAKRGSGLQEFVGSSSVSEPGSLTLLGTGLIGLAALIRRKFAKQ